MSAFTYIWSSIIAGSASYINFTDTFDTSQYETWLGAMQPAGWNLSAAMPRQLDFLTPGSWSSNGVILLYHELVILGLFIVVFIFLLLILMIHWFAL